MLKLTPYRAAHQAQSERENLQRLVVYMPEAVMTRIDNWGLAAGKDSRSAAVRALINKGFETQEKQTG
jgi:metal-responsive CopG/Arc/MetJ family transcriptional regulator